MRQKFPNWKLGYTLIEILIAITIIGLIFSFGYASFRDFSRRQALNGAVRTVLADLRLTQELALAGKKPSGCSAVLNSYKFTVTSISSYQITANCGSVDVQLKTVTVPNGISLSSPLPNPIIFKAIGSGTNISQGAIAVVRLTQEVTNSYRSIEIGGGGDIKESFATPNPSPTPTPSPTPIPLPTPVSVWHLLGGFTAGCGSSWNIGPLQASQFSINMTGGGGPDCTISFNGGGSGGSRWLVDGVWQGVPFSNVMSCGHTFYTSVFAQGSATQQSISVGCNDGETGSFNVSYYGP